MDFDHKKDLCEMVADECDAIISGLYEYQVTYENTRHKGKTSFIPFPIEMPDKPAQDIDIVPENYGSSLDYQKTESFTKGST